MERGAIFPKETEQQKPVLIIAKLLAILTKDINYPSFLTIIIIIIYII